MTPDATQHNPDPAYLRDLVAKTGLSQRELARRIGISDRLMRMYLADRATSTAQAAPYAVQYALEQLASKGD